MRLGKLCFLCLGVVGVEEFDFLCFFETELAPAVRWGYMRRMGYGQGERGDDSIRYKYET